MSLTLKKAIVNCEIVKIVKRILPAVLKVIQGNYTNMACFNLI